MTMRTPIFEIREEVETTEDKILAITRGYVRGIITHRYNTQNDRWVYQVKPIHRTFPKKMPPNNYSVENWWEHHLRRPLVEMSGAEEYKEIMRGQEIWQNR